jgi:hypothetical protein
LPNDKDVELDLEHTSLRIPFIVGLLGAVIAILFAIPGFTTGEIYIPSRRIDFSATGVVAYVMATAWLCLAASSLFAGAMDKFPQRYSQYRRNRDIAFFIFAVLYLSAVVWAVAKRAIQLTW